LLRLRSEQAAYRLDQVLVCAELAAGAGRQRSEVGEEAVGAGGERPLALVGIDVDAGHEQHRNVRGRRVAFQDLADAQPIDAAEQQVEDDGVRQFLTGLVQRLEPVLRGEDVEALALKARDERLQALRIVVGDEDPPGAAQLAHPALRRGARPVRSCAATSGRRGMRKRKALPLPGTLSTQIWPPCNSTRRLESARPSPMPS